MSACFLLIAYFGSALCANPIPINCGKLHDLIREDAMKEFALGDVEREVLDEFIHQLDSEVDFEDRRLYM